MTKKEELQPIIVCPKQDIDSKNKADKRLEKSIKLQNIREREMIKVKIPDSPGNKEILVTKEVFKNKELLAEKIKNHQ